MDIAEVLKRAKPPERTVPVCLAANLAAEHDELNRQLMDAQRPSGAGSAPAAGKAVELAGRIRDLEDRMRESVVTFRMRGLGQFRRQEWLDEHPGREGKDELFDPASGPVALVAACCIDPVMTLEDARELFERIGTGQADLLFNAAWEATNGGGNVPFSVAASVTLRGSELKL